MKRYVLGSDAMPEGDTILRAARSLEGWLAGREVTAA
jgi:hypothetical protein